MRVRVQPAPGDWPLPSDDRPIVTGHQQTLFHPGILAKYLAAEAATRGNAGCCWQVVVDQDVYEPLALDLPVVEGDRLRSQRVRLGRAVPDVPAACQPPTAFERIARVLAELDWPGDAAVKRDGMLAAFEGTDASADTLARQAWLANEALMHEISIDTPQPEFASELLQAPDHAWVVEALLHDAARCADLYNRAVRQYPGAGIAALRVERFLIETPLWALRWMQPRRRVFVDVADREPIFVTDDGQPVGDAATLAPRALLMTALMRLPRRCAAFVHGTGGWSYDRITERWWGDWRDQTLAPMTLATADVRMDFGVPLNDRSALAHAVWARHHVRHNVDRQLDGQRAGDAAELISRKHDLLAHMDDDRDRARRRAAFEEVHQINAQLRDRFPRVVEAAQDAVTRAQHGLANQATAARRDWFFGLYPSARIAALRQAVAATLDSDPAMLPGTGAGCQGGPPEAARPSP